MFKVNDTVICIDDKPVHGDPVKLRMDLKEGQTYNVTDISQCKCHTRLALAQSEGSRLVGTCYTCVEKCVGYYSWRFIKLAGDDVEVKELEKEEYNV